MTHWTDFIACPVLRCINKSRNTSLQQQCSRNILRNGGEFYFVGMVLSPLLSIWKCRRIGVEVNTRAFLTSTLDEYERRTLCCGNLNLCKEPPVQFQQCDKSYVTIASRYGNQILVMLTTNPESATEPSVKNDSEPVQYIHTLYQYSYRSHIRTQWEYV
jgi:hypothetical protein